MNFYARVARRQFSITSCKDITFYYDVVCPYSWYAFEVLQRYTKQWKLKIEYTPVFLGGIYKSAGNLSPGTVPAKSKNLNIDLARCAKYFGVPLRDVNYSEMLSKGSIEPMRFLTALKLQYPQHLENVSRQFWIRRFTDGKEFNSIEAIKKVVERSNLPSNGLNNILDMATTQNIKDTLRAKTQEVLDKGAFGVPVILIYGVDGSEEFYFGSDRFPMIAEELGETWYGPRMEN